MVCLILVSSYTFLFHILLCLDQYQLTDNIYTQMFTHLAKIKKKVEHKIQHAPLIFRESHAKCNQLIWYSNQLFINLICCTTNDRIFKDNPQNIVTQVTKLGQTN